MWERREGRRPPWAKYLVFAIVLADCIGIFYANKRLNQPWEEPAGAPSSEAIAQALDAPPSIGEGALRQPDAVPDGSAGTPANKLARLPEYMPVPAAVKEVEEEAVVPTVEMVLRQAEVDRPRFARLQPSRKASRRFISAFATDIANPGAAEAALPDVAFGAAAPAAAEAAGSESAAGIDTTAAQSQPEPQAPIASGPEQTAAPELEAQPSAELPAVAPATGGELPAS